MELTPFFKSIVDQDIGPVVICDLEHTILYMNPAAQKRYAGKTQPGRNLMNCHDPASKERIEQVLNWFASSPSNNQVHTFYNAKEEKDGYMVALRDEQGRLIGYFEKQVFRTKDGTPFYQLG